MSSHRRSTIHLLPLACLGWNLGVSAAQADDKTRPALPPTYVNEAPLPEGFPAPGAVGEVVEKEYPVIRSYSATGPAAFMSCFGYLSRHKHEMTAPVVMEAKPEKKEANPAPAPAFGGTPIPVDRMHFLLEKNGLDEPKTEGVVTVADMPRLRVLSIAHQGNLDADAVKAAEAKLQDKLKESPGLEPAGPIRILGYNSPFVARTKQYWEVQQPVRARPR